MTTQLSMGIKTERKEHSGTLRFIRNYYKRNGRFPTNEIVSTHIAKDHLREDKRYYSKLNKAKL